MPEILHETTVAADPAAVREAVTTSDGLAAFWTDQVKADPVVGSEAWFGFGPGAEIEFRFRVTDIGDDGVGWQCVAGPEEWIGTRVQWRFRPTDDGTAVRFAHLAWRSADGDLPRCSFVWAQVLGRLGAYLASGEPQPYFRRVA